MDKNIQASQIYARALYPLRRGCALWIPEPNNELTAEYCEAGVQIGDVGILRADGSFDFVFNVCRSADDPVNQYGVPDDFQTLLWNGAKRRTRNVFRPGEPVLSRGAEKRTLGVEGIASVPGVPVGGGAGFSIRFLQDRGAVILPPTGADSIDCQNLAVFRNYAERYSVNWYKFVNETLGMEIENGAIYFVTGFDKTGSWENAVFNNNVKERMCEILISTGGMPGGAARLQLSDSSLHESFSSRCSPSDNVNHNQALFIRGFRISIPHKLRAFFGGPGVEVTSTYESSFRDALGKKGPQVPFSGGNPSFSGSGSSSLAGSTSSVGPPSSSSASETVHMLDEAGSLSDASYADNGSDTSLEEDDLVPALELYHPLKAINDYILRSVENRYDIKVVITHDEDWIALVTDQDIEMPDDSTLIRRLQESLRITVKDGCVSLCSQVAPILDDTRWFNPDHLSNTPSSRNRLFNDSLVIGDPFEKLYDLPLVGNDRWLPTPGHTSYYDAPRSQVLFPTTTDSPSDLSNPEPFTRRSESKDNRYKPGACARCKNLKVRCEFKSNTDPCKRCLNGGHECVIPGRKKRRTPPKREHLLAEIHQQAETIEKLIAQLAQAEEAKKRHMGSSLSEPISDTSSPPILTPSPSPYFRVESHKIELESPAEKNGVEDWIVKARDSLAEFEGFIDIGGKLPMKSQYDFKEDPGGSEEDGEDSLMSEDEDPYSYSTVTSDEEDTKPLERKRMRGRTLGTRKRQRIGDTFGVQSIYPPRSHGTQLATPFGLMAKMKLKQRSSEKDGVDPANVDFSHVNDTSQALDIIVDGMLTPSEAEDLFELFFDSMNPSVSLVDSALYTPQRTVNLSPFLFTVICAIASKYYKKRPGLYQQAMSYAEIAAGRSILRGQKNVEMCMAYILLSLYPPPLTHREDSRSYLYIGVAIRIALELGLHIPPTDAPTNEVHAREQLNRTRVWLKCFNLDCFTSLQYGERPSISSTDYIVSHSENWWANSEYNLENIDIHLCCHTELMKTMAKFMEKRYSSLGHTAGAPEELDSKSIATDTYEELQSLQTKWLPILEANLNKEDPQAVFQTDQLELVYRYSRLVALSYGCNQTVGQNTSNDKPFLLRCVSAAVDVIEPMVERRDRQDRSIYVPHGLDTESLSFTSAVGLLVKFLQPNYASHLDDTTRLGIHERVRSAIDHLSSRGADANERQGYRMYVKFLQDLLASPLSAQRGNATVPSALNGKATSLGVSQPDIHDIDMDLRPKVEEEGARPLVYDRVVIL